MSKLDKIKEIQNIDTNLMEKKKQNKKRRTIVIGAASTFVVALFALVIVFGPKLTGADINSSEKVVDFDINQAITDAAQSAKYPLVVPFWAKTQYNETFFVEKETNVKDAIEWAGTTSFGFYSRSFPSRVQVTEDNEGNTLIYTNDPAKAINEDGTLNLLYSFVTKEDFEFAYATYTQRLLNPVFGMWTGYQYSWNNAKNEFNGPVLRDMFTIDWWTANIKDQEDYSKLPIIADWKSNDFEDLGLEIFDEGGSLARIFGEIHETPENQIVAEIVYDELPYIKVSSPVKFYAFTNNGGEALVFYGTLSMTLVPNTDDENNFEYRILIDDASLTVDYSSATVEPLQ